MATYSTAFKLEEIRRVLSTENPRGINEVSEKIALLLKQFVRSDLPYLSSQFDSSGFRHT